MDRSSCSIVLCAIFGVLVHFAAAQNETVYFVGDGMSWTVPSNTSAYTNWASGKTFRVGDILVFNFISGQHDVVQVPQGSYTQCNQSNVIGPVITVGPANITLNSTGDHFYICTVGRHCQAGQKLNITVVSSTPGGANPPPVAPPATPPATPPSTPAATPPATPPSTPAATPPATPPATPAATPPSIPAATPPANPATPSPALTPPGAGGPTAVMTPPPPPDSASTSLAAGFLFSLLSAGIALTL